MEWSLINFTDVPLVFSRQQSISENSIIFAVTLLTYYFEWIILDINSFYQSLLVYISEIYFGAGPRNLSFFGLPSK